jgi:peptidoglycan hydrolase-like protein with peptidoglycan-binding domain
MADLSITVRGSDQLVDVPTGKLNIIRVTRFNAELIEMEDVHFHLDSAVLLPDFALTSDPNAPEADRITGLAVLRTCLLHAQETSDLLLIAGHTDTTGQPDSNLTLSMQRAENVFCALTGDRDGWVSNCGQKHKVEDYQQILKWVARIWEWDCDPGEVDNSFGPKTKTATQEFQRSYNLDFSCSIAEDGDVGDETWGAFFDVYMEVLKLILETDDGGLAAYRQSLRFADPGNETVGCGQNFPIEEPRRAQYRSRINRRVELLFFNPAQLPNLNCHPGGGACSKGDCEIYELHHFRFQHLPVPPINIKTLKRWVIRVLMPGSGPPDQRKPFADTEYKVTGAGGPSPEIQGRTNAKGVLRIQVYDDPCVMTLKIAGLEFQVQGGKLDRIYEGDAVEQRLHNMAYGPDDLAAWTDDDSANAVQVFQKDHGLPVTGVTDDATRNKLRQVHGS